MAASINADDYYERLGLPRSATAQQIAQAYRSLVRQYSPERSPEAFKRIREAYEALGNTETRSAYDQRLPADLEAILRQAGTAMSAENYPTAEGHLKRALLKAPDLHFARNQLGLCLLYQERYSEALAQFARLVTLPNAESVWYVNLAHALGKLDRREEASRAFEEAAKRAKGQSGNLAEVYASWAELHLQAGDVATARQVVEQGVRADGAFDFDDLPLLLKLLEVELRQSSAARVPAVLGRIKEVSQEEDEKQAAAVKLGVMSAHLIRAEAYERALQVIAAARELQPADVDYDALEELARALERYDYEAAKRLVRSHVSFAPNGWLAWLTPYVLAFCEERKALQGMRRINSAPSLSTINTVGFKLYGSRDYDPATKSHITTRYFVVLFLPLCPIASYRVVDAGSDSWRFLGKVPFARKQRWHLIGFVIAALLLVIYGFIDSASSGQAKSYSPNNPFVNGNAQPGASSPHAPVDTRRTVADDNIQGYEGVPWVKSVVYQGTVTNSGLPNRPGSLTVTFNQWVVRDTVRFAGGAVEIGAPLDGSGKFISAWTKDSIRLLSMNAGGDTILWIAPRRGSSLAGRYKIIGGIYKGQGGWWSVLRSTSASLPELESWGAP